jgi:hypothetical protein
MLPMHDAHPLQYCLTLFSVAVSWKVTLPKWPEAKKHAPAKILAHTGPYNKSAWQSPKMDEDDGNNDEIKERQIKEKKTESNKIKLSGFSTAVAAYPLKNSAREWTVRINAPKDCRGGTYSRLFGACCLLPQA